MVRKIRLKTKNVCSKNDKSEPMDHNLDTTEEIPNSPTCIRCYMNNEYDIQNLNAMLMRFNIGRDNIVLQRVGYKMEGESIREIDIAALHTNGYTISPTEYLSINRYLKSFFEKNKIEFEFIDFSNSYKNSADCHLAIDGMTTLGEYITIEKGTLSDELFEYIRERLNIPVDIVSIRIPISDSTGFSITYHTEWIRHNDDKKDGNNNEDENIPITYKDESTVSLSVIAYTEDASDSIDLILSQFSSAIGRSICDYTEKNNDSYTRIIKMDITLNEHGKRLIDSLGWVNNVTVTEINRD